jgi:acetolactate synthase-1/2/3 large subunit
MKRAWRVSHRAALIANAVEACSVAISDNPGPVLLSVPLNFFSESREETVPNVQRRMPTSVRSLAPVETIEGVLQVLRAANRPLILAGGGAASSQAQYEVTQLAETLNIPVVTTLSGQGVITKKHRLYGGFISTVGTPLAHRLINSCDVLLVLGSRLGEMETSSFDPEISIDVSKTKLIQIDIDARQIGRQYQVEMGVVSDVKLFAAALTKIALDNPVDSSVVDQGWVSNVDTETREWKEEIRRSSNWDAKPISVERMLSDIREVLPVDGIFLTDVGIRHMVAQQFDVHSPETHYVASGWGTMGGAVAAALGSKVGRPDVTVISEVGDGAFSSILSAVVTAVEHEIAVVWVVMNNFSYGSISVYQAKHG